MWLSLSLTVHTGVLRSSLMRHQQSAQLMAPVCAPSSRWQRVHCRHWLWLRRRPNLDWHRVRPYSSQGHHRRWQLCQQQRTAHTCVPTDELHEVRCCSDVQLPGYADKAEACGMPVWTESNSRLRMGVSTMPTTARPPQSVLPMAPACAQSRSSRQTALRVRAAATMRT